MMRVRNSSIRRLKHFGRLVLVCSVVTSCNAIRIPGFGSTDTGSSLADNSNIPSETHQQILNLCMTKTPTVASSNTDDLGEQIGSKVTELFHGLVNTISNAQNQCVERLEEQYRQDQAKQSREEQRAQAEHERCAQLEE